MAVAIKIRNAYQVPASWKSWTGAASGKDIVAKIVNRCLTSAGVVQHVVRVPVVPGDPVRGGLLRAQGHLPEAIAVHQRLIEVYPNLPDAYRILGFLKLAVGQANEAIPLLQRSIRLDPVYHPDWP